MILERNASEKPRKEGDGILKKTPQQQQSTCRFPLSTVRATPGGARHDPQSTSENGSFQVRKSLYK